ncbi:unnamed protein product [Brachionus calyciflorus]|uniref:Uncharacterized protein n=1 Tax=Brachionus calyciflorus TaxID=104777 RepID=A0A813XUV7_9BILA|nr:unnamed protein product [Brachionus calyciflorus]
MVIVKEIRIKCNYCTIHYSYGNGATSNIINNFRTKHLDKLENEELCDRPLNNDSSEDNFDTDSEEINKKKRKKTSISDNFASATAIAITLDLWTSIQCLPYLGVTSHYIDSVFNLKSAPIAVKHLPGQHKKEKIKDELLDLMEKWSLADKVFGFVSDHASNVIDIAFNKNNSLNQNHPTNKYNIVQFGCATNLLNLFIKNITKFTKINGELDIVNFGNIFSNQLNLAQNSLNIKNHQLIKDVTPRWNSTYLTVERVYEQADAIDEALKSKELCRKFDVFKLNEEEKESMQEIIIVLSCFYDATVILSGS